MAGLYLHIPFCKQKCHYCDFHFSTSLKYKDDLLKALNSEIRSRKKDLSDPIETIYFGGGTPSILSKQEIENILETIYKNYSISDQPEITLECNPDDLSDEKLRELKAVGVNRLSIGIQSFFDEDLSFFNRAHSAEQSVSSVLQSQDAGFDNITIDLIFGSPILSHQRWEQNLEQFNALDIPHLSAYNLTVEPKTALHHQIASGKVPSINDEHVLKQFELLMEFTSDRDYIQYEISNYAKDGFWSKHNSSYWLGKPYLGFGPSAHSYFNGRRQWNIANNIKYIKALQSDTTYFEHEDIDDITALNEYLLTRLRTIWGLDAEYIKTIENEKVKEEITSTLNDYLHSGHLDFSDNSFTLTKKGKFIADKITSDLFQIS